MVFAQAPESSATARTENKVSINESVKANLIANKPVDKAELDQVIQSELQYMKSEKKLEKRRVGDLIELIALSAEADFLSQPGKIPTVKNSSKQMAELSNCFVTRKLQMRESGSKAAIEKAKMYLEKRASPRVAEVHWNFYRNFTHIMQSSKAAQMIWNGLISSQINQGLLAKALKTSLEWTSDKRPDLNYNTDALNRVATLPYGTYDTAFFEANLKSMQAIATIPDNRVVVHKARLDYLKGQYLLCEKGLAPLLNSATDSEFYRRFYFRIVGNLQKCYLAQKKVKEAQTLFDKKIPTALAALLQKHPKDKIRSDLRFQIGFGQRKEAFKTCSKLLEDESLAYPFSYMMTLSTCFVLKTPTDAWQSNLVSKYAADVRPLSAYADNSREMYLLMQIIREAYPDYKLPKGSVSVRDETIKKFGDDELVSIALNIKTGASK